VPWVGQKVVSRPSAYSFAVGQRQKEYVDVLSDKKKR
jgi:hypothetical protein